MFATRVRLRLRQVNDSNLLKPIHKTAKLNIPKIKRTMTNYQFESRVNISFHLVEVGQNWRTAVNLNEMNWNCSEVLTNSRRTT